MSSKTQTIWCISTSHWRSKYRCWKIKTPSGMIQFPFYSWNRQYAVQFSKTQISTRTLLSAILFMTTPLSTQISRLFLHKSLLSKFQLMKIMSSIIMSCVGSSMTRVRVLDSKEDLLKVSLDLEVITLTFSLIYSYLIRLKSTRLRL